MTQKSEKFRNDMIKKYSVKPESIIKKPTKIIDSWSWKNKTVLITDAYYYTCECWTIEVFWFIDKLEWKCKSCSWFQK